MSKITKFIFISLFIWIIIIVFIYVSNKNNKIVTVENNTNITPGLVETKKTTLYFVGDIMLTRGVESSVIKNFNGDYSKLFDNLTVLKDAGFDIVSFANNHVGDWNMNAFKDTLSRLEEVGILKTGAGQNKEDATNPTLIEKNGTVFGFLGFSDVGPNWIAAKDNTAGILLASDPKLGEIIKNAKAKCDVLIVSFHFGEEYKLVHNKRQEYLAHTAIDSGADMIIGQHPHVMEDIEEYKGKPIVYSLGNFIFDQYFSKDTMRGMFFSATYDGKNLIETNKKIITLNNKYQPEGIFTVDEIKKKDEISSVSVCPKPKKEYEDMSLLNIGQTTSLPDITYTPDNLVELNTESSTKKGICLTKETYDAFLSMLKNAKTDKNTLKASSGFRSYEYQKALLSADLKRTGMNTSISVAKAGYSEHQLGTSIDITGASINYDSAVGKFDKTPEDIWLTENAHLYGFIQSYPKGKEDITLYKYEPWHYRYVGIENAKKIKDLGLTITEFLK